MWRKGELCRVWNVEVTHHFAVVYNVLPQLFFRCLIVVITFVVVCPHNELHLYPTPERYTSLTSRLSFSVSVAVVTHGGYSSKTKYKARLSETKSSPPTRIVGIH